jgi:hypothetical protein
MVFKIFKGVWFFSLLALFGIFIYVYAGLPEEVLFSDEASMPSLGRNGFFYSATLLFALVNSLVYIITRLVSAKGQEFYSWFYGLIITLNAFFISTLSYVFVVNAGERYDYSRLGPGVYGGLLLVIAWMAGGLLLLLFRKFSSKQTI